jgi:hypothetical protein
MKPYKISEKYEELLKYKDELLKIVNTLTEDIKNECHENLKVVCSSPRYQIGCGELLYAKNLTLIRNHHYIEPTGCMGGDYYVMSHFSFHCPHCGGEAILAKELEEEPIYLTNCFFNVKEVY